MDAKLNELIEKFQMTESNLFAYVTRLATLGKVERVRLREMLNLNRGFRDLLVKIDGDMKKDV